MLQLFFVEDLNNPILINENAHHANRVLRMSVGEQLLISNGFGDWARCQIKSVSKSEVALEILEKGSEPETPIKISVIQALPKSDRAKEAVELLTASGANEIYPWRSARSIGKDSEKWEVAAIEAAKQSRRFNIPKVYPISDTTDLLQLFREFDQILVCHESATTAISEIVKPAKNTLIIIGPEGGLTEEELSLFTTAGAKVIKLGRPILRSAHAGLAAVSAVSALMRVW